MADTFQNPFAGDEDFQYLALDRKKLLEEAPPFDAKTSCWIVDQKEGYIKANIKSTKGEEVTVITEASLEVSILRIQVTLNSHCTGTVLSQKFSGHFPHLPLHHRVHFLRSPKPKKYELHAYI